MPSLSLVVPMSIGGSRNKVSFARAVATVRDHLLGANIVFPVTMYPPSAVSGTHVHHVVTDWRLSLSLPSGWRCCSFTNSLDHFFIHRALKNMIRGAARHLSWTEPRSQPTVSAKVEVTASPTQYWSVNVALPGDRHFRMNCGSTTKSSDLYKRVICRAAAILATDKNDIYSLYNGKHYGSFAIPLIALGMYNSCTVDVLISIKGGVFLPSREKGRKRKVRTSAYNGSDC